MFSNMTGDGARVRIVAASRRVADDETDRFAFVEILAITFPTKSKPATPNASNPPYPFMTSLLSSVLCRVVRTVPDGTNSRFCVIDDASADESSEAPSCCT